MRRLAAALVALAVLLPLGAWGVERLGADGSATPAPEAATAAATTPSPPPTPTPTPSSTIAVEGETAPGADPVRVRVPSAGIDVGTEDLEVGADGRLQAPEAWGRAGWYAEGPAPGDVGPAVVAGHVDSPTGPAAFTGLSAVEAGDVVEVERADGSVVDFTVDRLEVVAKDDFPTAAVYGPTPDAQLRLVTCDGPYVQSSGGYQDNLVVWATATDSTVDGDDR